MIGATQQHPDHLVAALLGFVFILGLLGALIASYFATALLERLHVGESAPADRQQFIAFWADENTFKWRHLAVLLMRIIAYSLLLYAISFTTRLPTGIASLTGMVLTVLFGFAAPVVDIELYRKRNARFILCRHCGSWLGRHTTDDDSKWQLIVKTGRCFNCGQQVLMD